MEQEQAEPVMRLEPLELEESAALLALRPAERRKEPQALVRREQRILVARLELAAWAESAA